MLSCIRRWLGRALASLVLTAAAGIGAAQERGTSGVLAGTVMDAENGAPLSGVVVALEPVSAGVLPERQRGSSPFLQATRSVVTSASGEYVFGDLAPGPYQLRFSRVGYRPTRLEVEVRGNSGSRVSVGMQVEPVMLEPLTVTGQEVQPFGRPGVAGGGISRVEAERRRQEHFLASDVRSLTHPEVLESISLGETDLFRSLQRLPGVGGRDAWSAELWTRGATWDQTRVYFDGLPLFSPTHGMGLFSGVNADAVGAAFLHPGVQPVALGGGAAGAVDLRSRRGGGEGEVRGTGELSLVSSRLALEQEREGDGTAWLVAGRRTYLDLLTGAIERVTGGDDIHVPYSFSDAVVRSDYRLGDASALEISVLYMEDRVAGDIPDVLHRSRANWGGGAARATLAAPLFGLESRHTLGFSGFGSRSSRVDADSLLEQRFNAPGTTPASNDLWYVSLAGELRPSGASPAPAPWRLGYELIGEEVHYWGPEPLRYRAPRERLTKWDHALSRGALWAERRWQPDGPFSLAAGLRLEAGPAVRGTGPLRAAPRLAARYQVLPRVALSATTARTYQYEQAIAPGGLDAVSGFRSEYLWVLASDSVPVIRADLQTLGAEWWLGPSWLGAATAYLRHSSGIMVPNPEPGDLLTGERPFVAAEGIGRGVELSLRRLAGRWTAAAAYSYAATELKAGERRFPAPGDRRHELDATLMLRLGGSWRVGTAFSAASGLPFTRVVEGEPTCERWSSDAGEWEPLEECEWARRPVAGEPGAQRGRAQQRLDLLLAWNRAFRTWELSAFVQLHNALAAGWRDRGAYTGSYPLCDVDRSGAEPVERCRAIDEFLPGVPPLPVLGVRIAF